MIPLGLVVALALGGEGPPDLEEEVGEGVTVNWTELTVRVSGQGRSNRVAQVTPVEELARREVAAALRQSIGRVRVAPDLAMVAVMANPEVGASVRARAARWLVTEATYGTSGRVTLVAELELHDVLKPWLLTRPRAGVPAPAPEAPYTGLLVDARGTGALPAYAPVISAPSGEVLYGNEFDVVNASVQAPVRYVSDPAHPASMALGVRPLVVAAAEAHGALLVLPVLSQPVLAGVRELLSVQAVMVVVDAP